MIKGKLVEAPWWPSGYESGLSLPWPEFNPWLGNQDLTSYVAQPKEKKESQHTVPLLKSLPGLPLHIL